MPGAVIFDRDGTLGSCQRHFVDGSLGRQDWGEFNNWLRFDAPVPGVAALFRLLRETTNLKLLITTGRDESLRRPMMDWLEKHSLHPDYLLMRRAADRRLDSVVKKELYDMFIEPYYDVKLVIDDRPQVIEMWRAEGLPVIAVADPGLPPPIARNA